MVSEKVVLAHDEKVLFCVNRSPLQRAETLLEPADELIRCLSRSLGTSIPQAKPGVENKLPVALVLHLDYLAPLSQEEFEVDASAERIELRGRTDEAVSHAVYWFLEKAIGARWLWPGPLGEVIPHHSDLSFPIGTWRHKPDYAWRHIGVGGPLFQAMDYNTTLHSVLGLPLQYIREFETWCRRNRFGGLKIADGHRWSEIAPAEVYGKTHPEIYSLSEGHRDANPHDGKHGNQPCLSNPKVIELMAEYVNARFDKEKNLDVCSIALNDGGSTCECPECLEIDRQAGAENVTACEHFDEITDEVGDAERSQQRSITDRVIWQANQVIEKVSHRCPTCSLLILLYAQFRRPPVTYHLDERIIGQYCVQSHSLWHAQNHQTELERIREMAKSVPALGIYDYFSQGAWPEVHRLFPKLVERCVREYHNAGVRYFATQPSTGFAINGINFFVLGRCLWDISISAEDVMDDFCRSGFGAGADTIRCFLNNFASQWQNTSSGSNLPSTPLPYLSLAHLYPEEFLTQRQADLNQAKQLVSHDDASLARTEFLECGLRYTRLFCDACRATLAVYEIGGIDEDGLPKVPSNTSEVDRFCFLAMEATRAWQAYWAFVNQSKGQYVYGEFWVNYRWFVGPGMSGQRHPLLARLQELGNPRDPGCRYDSNVY